jgi:aminopeptidase YwaD
MKHKRFVSVLFSLLLSAAPLLAQQAAPAAHGALVPEAARLRGHVTYLASPRLEGRKTGTQGAKDASDYIAAHFMRYGLRPAAFAGSQFGDRHASDPRGFFQEFPYVAGVELGRGNALTVTRRVTEPGQGAPLAVDLGVGQDWMPLGFGSNGQVEGPLVFVGYGITAAEQGHNDYKDAGAAGKVALAFAGTPEGDNPHGRLTRAGEPRFKAAAARAAGARALVLVAAEDEFKHDRLAQLRYDNAGEAGLPVAVISRQMAAKLLGLANSKLLSDFERTLRAVGGASGQSSTEVGSYHVTTKRQNELASGVVINLRIDLLRRNVPAANVVGLLEGSDPKLRGEYIVVGAHYDHLGRGGAGSLATREGEIHHGADDNASGTAALLELARLLSAERAKLRRSVLFIAFGGEEEGLLGSKHYVEHPIVALEQTVAMLNLDMVGRLRGGALSVGGVGTAAEWRELLSGINHGWKVELKAAKREAGETDSGGTSGATAPRVVSVSGQEAQKQPENTLGRVVITGTNGETVATAAPGPRFELRLNEDGMGPSDHASFYLKRVPVLFFFTGSHEDYHKPTDTADRVNYEGLVSIASFVRDVVEQLQTADARPTFTTAKVEASARSTGFRVYLGTIPAYGDSTDGLKLDGVREGSPAEKAGLKAGDRIIRLADRDVRNVYDYTQALSEMKAGVEYEVEIVRDGQRQTLKLTPAARR